MKKKVAIFDIDGTIFRSSLLIELVNELIDREVFPSNADHEYKEEYSNWLHRKGAYKDYIDGVVNVFMKNIKGVKYQDMLGAAEVVISHQENKVYRFTRDLVNKLKEENYFLLAVSHSPKLIVDGLTKSLGFDKVYGTLYETDKDEVFTGKMLEEDLIFDKAKILDRAVEKENLALEDSLGVGDTESDIPFLSKVSNPICFNPNSLLYNHAKENGWKVVVERKDVVYELNS